MISLQKSKITIAHLNIRSLKNKKHLIQLRNFAQEENHGILAVSESWLNSTVTNAEVEIVGNKVIQTRQAEQNRRRRLCIHSKFIENKGTTRSERHFQLGFSPIMASNPTQEIEILSSLCRIQATRLSYILFCGRFYG